MNTHHLQWNILKDYFGSVALLFKKSCETSLHIKTIFVILSSIIVLLQKKNGVLSNVTVL